MFGAARYNMAVGLLYADIGSGLWPNCQEITLSLPSSQSQVEARYQASTKIDRASQCILFHVNAAPSGMM